MTSKIRSSDVASRLREARKLAGLSQGQVAKLMGIHRPTVTEIEAGNRRVSADELREFARLYDVGASWLLGEVDHSAMTPDPKVQLAARELGKLKPEDLERMLKLLTAMRNEQT